MSGPKNTPAEGEKLYHWIAAGLSSGILINAAAWMYWPRLSPLTQAVDRLMLALQCLAGIGFVALLILQGLWRLKDTPEAEDPLANAESRGWRINQRVLSNTIEQALIFAPIFVALSIRMEPQDVYMLPALMTIWCVGRLVFWAGYRYSLNARVIGMDWTTVTTTITAIWFVATLF
jgi:MAPEG family protein